MAKQCRVVRNNQGQIESVVNNDGTESTLFNSLNKITKNPEVALEYYAISETDEFKETFNIGESIRDKAINNYNQFGILYHGTSNDNISNIVSPPNTTGVIQEKGRKKNLDKVFFSKSEKSANIYAGRAFNAYGGNKRVLNVIPLGEVTVLNDTKGTEVYMADSALVVDSNREIIPQIDSYLSSINYTTTEPTAKEIFEFNNSSEKNSLSNQEILGLQNAMLSTGFSSSTDLYEKLYSVLVNQNGIITFNEDKLKSVYNDYEVARIVSSPELQQTIKQSFLKLKNTPEVVLDYNDMFIIPTSTGTNIFGKQLSSNPFVLEKEIDAQVAGVSEEVIESLEPNIVDRYITNQEFKQVIDEKAKTLRNVPLLTTVDGQLVQKEDNIKNYLQDIIINESNNSLTEDITFLATYPANKWEQRRTDIQEIIENVVERAKDNGIDLRDFAIRTQAMSREEIISFLGSMEDVLENTNEENVNAFSDLYNSVLKATTPINDVIASTNQYENLIETNLSEYEMFRDFGMVKKSENIYRKVSEQDLQELYDNYFQNNPQVFKTVDELITFVQNEGIQKLNITDFQIDTELLEKMYLYKNHFGFPITISPKVITTDNLSMMTLSEDYLKDDFLKEFNRFLLQTGNEYFSVNDKGINIVSNDAITTSEALASLPVEMIELLAEYNAISKNLNIDLQPMQPDFINLDNKLDKRLEAVNNPQSVPKLQGEYTYLEQGVMAVKGKPQDFVRTPNGIHEMVYEQQNVKFYGQLPQADQNYKLVDVKAPLSNIDYDNYRYLNTTPEIFKQVKDFYTKKELENINQQYFNCQ